jgi:menaquinone-dependent protoporphyrinogen IX oxidase
MAIEYVHASKYGNGAAVAAKFQIQMAARGVVVNVHHVRELRPMALPPADLYVFSSPGRIGKPIRSMRRFLGRAALPAGTRYAILSTEVAAKPERAPTRQRVRPIMNEILEAKGLVNIAEETILVTGLKGPLEDGWQDKVRAFADRISEDGDVLGPVIPLIPGPRLPA